MLSNKLNIEEIADLVREWCIGLAKYGSMNTSEALVLTKKEK